MECGQPHVSRRSRLTVLRQQVADSTHLSVQEAAAAYGITRSTVRKWRRRLHNPDYLTVRKPKGRSWLLPLEARQWLVELVKQPATIYGFEDPHWTTKKVRSMLDRKFGIQISRTTAWNYLRRSDLTPQKPDTLYREQDPEKARLWREGWPKLLEVAKQRNALIFWFDESTVSLVPNVNRTWGTRGKTPVLRITGRRGGVVCLSSVSIEGHLHWWTHRGKLESDVVYNYLVDLKYSFPDREVIVVLDNDPRHKSKWFLTNIAGVPGLHLRFLPPYSPEMNVDEDIWRMLKRVKLKGLGARNVAELEEVVKVKMAEIAQDTEFLLKLSREWR